jgi:hypothetical protein
MNGELDRIWKDAVKTYFSAKAGRSFGAAEEYHRRRGVRLVGYPAERGSACFFLPLSSEG